MFTFFLSLLIEEGVLETRSHLSVVIVAGEACSRQLIALHHKYFEAVSLYNEYGPTEGSVWSSVYRCNQASSTLTKVPIGKPIAKLSNLYFRCLS